MDGCMSPQTHTPCTELHIQLVGCHHIPASYLVEQILSR